jgi:hypothetical protein
MDTTDDDAELSAWVAKRVRERWDTDPAFRAALQPLLDKYFIPTTPCSDQHSDKRGSW